MKKRLKRLYKKWLGLTASLLPVLFVNRSFFSTIYYLLFSNAFKREKLTVLNGKVKHIKEAKRSKASLYTLIRNTHRLEKGLLMRPRRDVFALDFIVETMDNFENLYKFEDCKSSSQIKWSHDVLNEYFKVTGSHVQLDKQRNRFNTITSTSDSQIISSIPYKRSEENRPNLSFDEFYKLTRFRRSVRWFLNKPVDRNLLDKALSAANQAPSACNRQPFEYRVLDDAELVRKAVKIPMGTAGYGHAIPVFIVIVGNLDAYFDERDRHVIYIDASLSSMSFMLALETLGLSSCAVNWPDVEHKEREMHSLLDLKDYQRPIMCMAVGYPDPEGMVAFSEKRQLDSIRRYN